MENKQTAVDYIVNIVNSCIAPDYIPNEIVMQAKQMEREQIIQFAKQCLDKALDLDIRTVHSNVEKYYNETYGKQDKQTN